MKKKDIKTIHLTGDSCSVFSEIKMSENQSKVDFARERVKTRSHDADDIKGRGRALKIKCNYISEEE